MVSNKLQIKSCTGGRSRGSNTNDVNNGPRNLGYFAWSQRFKSPPLETGVVHPGPRLIALAQADPVQQVRFLTQKFLESRERLKHR